jgi:hypothetical protein
MAEFLLLVLTTESLQAIRMKICQDLIVRILQVFGEILQPFQ